MEQLLLFSQPKNFHLQYLYGRPIGTYSLRKYCYLWIKEHPGEMNAYNHGIIERISFSESVKKKIEMQRLLMKSYKDGHAPMRPHWMKQRVHWNKFKKAIRNGESITVNKVKINTKFTPKRG